MAIIAGHDPSTFTHNYNATVDLPYIETLVPVTTTGYVTTIYAATTASSNTNAWNIGVGSLSGSTFTPSSNYVTLDVWANDPTEAMTNRTFVAGTDFANPGLYVVAGQYIAFESIGFGGPAPTIGRNTGGSGYRYWASGSVLWPDEIGNGLTTTSSTAARLEVGFDMVTAGATIDKVNGVSASGISRINGVLYSGIAKINGMDA